MAAWGDVRSGPSAILVLVPAGTNHFDGEGTNSMNHGWSRRRVGLKGLLAHRMSKALPDDPIGCAKILRWCEYAAERGPACLIGAGMSLQAPPRRGAPSSGGEAPRARTWNELAARLRARLELSEQTTADPLWVAELYEQNFGRPALLDELAWAVPMRDLEPSTAHQIITGIDWSDLFTTNYDDLLERADSQRGRPSVVTDVDLVPSPGASYSSRVIHLHGRLDARESIILTLEDYRTYPARRPGLWTNARQVFLERPVLLVGFSATDPNFVNWVGWVSDTVGKLSPMHLNINVTTSFNGLSQARGRYWKDRLTVVDVPVRQLEQVLEVVRDYLGGTGHAVDFDGVSNGILNYINGSPDICESIRRAGEAANDVRDDVTAEVMNGLTWRIFEALVRYAANRPPGIGDVDTFIQRLKNADAEMWPPHMRRPEQGEFWTRAEKLMHLRSLFGREWPSLLRLLLVMDKRETPYVCGVSVPLREEAVRLGGPLADDVNRTLDYRALRDGLVTGGKAASDVEAFLSAGALSAAERADLDALIAYQALKSGRDLPPSPTPTSAIEWRRSGWFAARDLRPEDAWNAYRTALDHLGPTTSPGERWLALRSAVKAGHWARTLVHREVVADAEIARLEDALARLVADHRSAATAFEDGLRRAEEFQRKEEGKVLALPSARTDRSIFSGDPRDYAGPILDQVEQAWMHPDLGARAAAIALRAFLRHARLRDLDVDGRIPWGGAIDLALRYNLDGADAALGWWRDAGDPDREEPRAPVEALCASVPTWDGGWRATFRLLAATTPWLTAEEVAVCIRRLGEVPEAGRARRVRAGVMVSREEVDGWDMGLPLRSALAKVVDFPQVERFLVEFDESRLRRNMSAGDDFLEVLADRITAADRRGHDVRHLLRRVVELQVGSNLPAGSDAAGIALAEAAKRGGRAEQDAADRDLLQRWAQKRSPSELWAIVADRCFPSEAITLAQEIVVGLLSTGGRQFDERGRWAVLTHLVDRLSSDSRARVLELATEVAEGIATSPDRSANDRTDDQVPRDVIAAVLPALALASRGADAAQLARAHVAWFGLAGPHLATIYAIGMKRFPDDWLDDKLGILVDDALRGRGPSVNALPGRWAQPPSRDAARRLALVRSSHLAYRGHDFAWARLPAVGSIVRHADALVQANAVRWVGGLAHAGGRAKRPWDRWLEVFDAFSDDRRVQVQAALATVVVESSTNLPTKVKQRLEEARSALVRDDRAAVQAALRGV